MFEIKFELSWHSFVFLAGVNNDHIKAGSYDKHSSNKERSKIF